MISKVKNIVKFRKTLIILIIGIIVSANSFSQPITWQKIINGPYLTSDEYGYASCRADGDNIYILGSISNGQIYLLKLNSLGDTLWTKIISMAYSRGSAIVESDSGSCVLTGDIQNGQAFSIKVDKNGSIVWHKYYGGSYVQMNDIKRTTNNSYILCGRENFFNAVLLKINSAGDLVWYKNFSAGYNINFQSLTETDQNDIILTGWKSESSSQLNHGLIFKVDENGNYIWDTTFIYNSSNTGGMQIIKTDNGFAVSGEIYFGKVFFLRTNEYGNIIYTHIFSSIYRYFDLGGFKMINENKFILNFSQDSMFYPINGKIMIIDSLGSEIKSKVYTCQRQMSFGSITMLADTGFIFCGTIDNNLSSNRDIYVIKADTSLNANPPIGIIGSNSTIPKNFKLHQNYPNPFNPVTNIKFEIPNESNVTIKIFDILGKEVFSINEYKRAGSYELSFDGSALASGMYFYKFSAESPHSGVFTDTKKMVLIK